MPPRRAPLIMPLGRQQHCTGAPEFAIVGIPWKRAYILAYRGPASDNLNLFESLVLADRECRRERFEQMEKELEGERKKLGLY